MTEEPNSLPKTSPDDWIYSTRTMHSARFWSPFDPGFAQALKTLDGYVQSGSKVLEIGCAPGKMLAWAAIKKKAKISGIDYSHSGISAAKSYMKMLGICADLRKENIFETTFKHDAFDVVYSVGVIEHFDNPAKILQAHLNLAKPGGFVVMFMPNYGGFWGKVQKWLDPQNLAIHNVDMMNLGAMKNLMCRLKCEIVCIGYRGSFSTSILSIEKLVHPKLAGLIHKTLNAFSTFLPIPIGSLAPQIVTVVRKI